MFVLSNFHDHTALVPPPQQLLESNVEEYLNRISDSDDESESSNYSEYLLCI